VARKEFKDEQLLTRLIGAGVLLAIAVIVLPFILDGSGSQQVNDDIEPLPEQPPRQPRQTVQNPAVVESSYSSRQRPVAPVQEQPAQADNKLPKQQPSPSSDSAVVADKAPASSVVNSTASEPPAPVQAAPLPTSSIPAGWNIQVASFVVESNAVNLLADLQRRGMPAFANAVEGSKGTVFRVFVGPLGNQIDALDMQNRVNRQYRVESIMVRRD